MITVEDREAYYLEHKSIRQIAREQHYSRRTIRKALKVIFPQPYQRTRPNKVIRHKEVRASAPSIVIK